MVDHEHSGLDPITLHPDGSVEVSPEFAHHVMAVAAHAAAQHTDDLQSTTLVTILAMTAGYTAGYTALTRNDACLWLEHIDGAFRAGMGIGLELNQQLPRLNG